MPPRSTWKGYLKLSLVSVPVKAYSAISSGAGEIHLNQLHEDCNNRIKYKKTCPIHGEVSNDAIVSGYEYSKGQYVVVEPDELDKLRTEDDKAVKIDAFISPDQLDPAYFSGRTYYLLPDGPVGERPFAVLCRAMVDENCCALAKVVLNKREQLVLLRPLDRLIAMSPLNYDFQVTKPATFQEEIPKTDIPPEELKLAKSLIEASTVEKPDLASYRDEYIEKLTKLIEAKVAGEEIVAPPVGEPPHILNLMDALRKSVAQARKTQTGRPVASKRPPKKMAPSTRGTKQESRKKKSS